MIFMKSDKCHSLFIYLPIVVFELMIVILYLIFNKFWILLMLLFFILLTPAIYGNFFTFDDGYDDLWEWKDFNPLLRLVISIQPYFCTFLLWSLIFKVSFIMSKNFLFSQYLSLLTICIINNNIIPNLNYDNQKKYHIFKVFILDSVYQTNFIVISYIIQILILILSVINRLFNTIPYLESFDYMLEAVVTSIAINELIAIIKKRRFKK